MKIEIELQRKMDQMVGLTTQLKELLQTNRTEKEELEKRIRDLEKRVNESEKYRAPEIGWISQKDFCLMAGRDGKDGARIPINRSTFHSMVKESNGLIKIVKIKGLVWVVDYPGKASGTSA